MKKHKKLALIIAASFLVLLVVLTLLFRPLAQTAAPISEGRGGKVDVMRGLCPGIGIYTGEYPTYRKSHDFHILKGEKENYDQAIKDAANPNYSYYYNCWAYPVQYRLFL